MLGAYTAFTSKISSEEMDVFKAAMGGLVGVSYTPLCVSTQVVAGMNYRFFCNAIGIYPNATDYGAMVNIYQPLEGQPHITSIQRCE